MLYIIPVVGNIGFICRIPKITLYLFTVYKSIIENFISKKFTNFLKHKLKNTVVKTFCDLCPS